LFVNRAYSINRFTFNHNYETKVVGSFYILGRDDLLMRSLRSPSSEDFLYRAVRSSGNSGLSGQMSYSDFPRFSDPSRLQQRSSGDFFSRSLRSQDFFSRLISTLIKINWSIIRLKSNKDPFKIYFKSTNIKTRLFLALLFFEMYNAFSTYVIINR